MKVQNILDGMESRALNKQYMEGIRSMYDARDYGDTEPDYQNGMEKLQDVLTDDQKVTLQTMEDTYKARRVYAAQYGFKCGIYGAFRQYFGFSGAKDGGFQDLVCDDLLMQPKMQRHHENYANIELCNQIDSAIMDALSEEDRTYMVSIACAWQQRVYSAAMDGFYCGYRAAYDIMEEIRPLVKIENMDKILTMEYHLGFIKPYSEVERLGELRAA